MRYNIKKSLKIFLYTHYFQRNLAQGTYNLRNENNILLT
jgi:hypothetical protein